MKRPVVGLLIQGKDAMELVAKGWKTITIREGHRDYQVGDRLMLGCHWISWMVFAEVTYVRHCLAREVPPEDFADDGYSSHAEMIEDLRSFGGAYASMTVDSPVTVVRWGDVQGKLVSELANTMLNLSFMKKVRVPLPMPEVRKALFETVTVFGPGVRFESILESLKYNKWVEVNESGDYVSITPTGYDAARDQFDCF